jgi:hypothetical protein
MLNRPQTKRLQLREPLVTGSFVFKSATNQICLFAMAIVLQATRIPTTAGNLCVLWTFWKSELEMRHLLALTWQTHRIG